jgi:CRP-like cAMP-binding protein
MMSDDLSPEALSYLSGSSLFGQLAPDALDRVLPYLVSIEIETGKTLFREGDRGDYLAIVVSGALDVWKRISVDQNTRIGQLAAGDVVGEMSVADRQPRSATIRAATDSALLVMRCESLDQMRRRDPDIALMLLAEIARFLSQKLRRMSERVTDIRSDAA